jgi:hypothetical protein
MAPKGSGTGGKQRQTAPFTYRCFGWCSWLSSLAPPLSGIEPQGGASGLARIRRRGQRAGPNPVVVNGNLRHTRVETQINRQELKHAPVPIPMSLVEYGCRWLRICEYGIIGAWVTLQRRSTNYVHEVAFAGTGNKPGKTVPLQARCPV